MIEMSASIGHLAAALHKAQGVMGGAAKDAKNPAFKSKYATLENVIEAAKPAMQSAGIFYTQAPGHVTDGMLEMTTMLIHAESGEWMRSALHVPLPKRDPQGLGSAITYARRYALMSVLGMPAEDDDGNAASVPANAPARQDTAPVPTKSSASLKRAGPDGQDAWDRLMADLRQDLLDVQNKFQLAKLRADYRERAKSERWPHAWLGALANEFDQAEDKFLEAAE